MTTLKANKRWICLAVILYLTGCGAESESDNLLRLSTPAPDNTSAGVARVELVSDASTVDYDGSITLNWTTSQVQDCVALGDWSGNKSTSGSETIDSLKTDSTFELACNEIDAAQESSVAVAYKGKPIKASVNISVKGPKQPTLSMSASPTTVSVNGTTTISWSSKFAKSCTASGGWSGNKTTSGSQAISALTADSTFNFTCSGDGGSASDSVSITVAAPSAPGAPIVSLSASPVNVAFDGSTTLTWTTQDADSCVASGGWTGGKNTSGSNTINNLTADTSFSLSCTGPEGTGTDQISVIVSPQVGAPVVNLWANPMNVAYNGSTSLSWTTENADSCVASGDWSGSRILSASGDTGSTWNITSGTYTYTLTCTGVGGTESDSVTITVADPPPTLSFTASPESVAQNGSSTLSWDSPGATGCVASGDWSGNKAAAGSQTFSGLTIDRQFNLACSGPGGSVNGAVDVTVVLSSNGTALLSWTPPTQNTDDTLLTDLAGYKIRYGTSSGNYSDTITLNNKGLSSYLVENLPSADWYFVMTSFNSSDIESSYSIEVSKTIN